MGSSIFNQAAEFLRENKTAKRALGIMVCLALLVALGTVGVLTSTGQAMTQKVKTLDCSFAVHQHTDDCYDGAGNIVCGRADYVVHVHNDDCRNEAGEIVCDLPEIWPHTHTDECWQDVTELVCGQAEDLGHTHSDACYSYELTDELICGLEEHTHDAACYRPVDVLSCEIAEHTHNEACYDENGALICELPEHTHDGTCYTQGQELACGKEEHTHTDACYKQNATLTCGLEERPAGHVHSDECYKTEHVLVCDKLENHEHTEDCYAHDEAGNRLDLICGKTELLEHTHDESCFKIEEVPVVEQSEPSEAPAYVCGLEEHTHSDECKDENGEIVCGLEEHTHGESCLAAPEQETYCGLVEHTHSDACLNEAGEIICGLEEHTHTDECFVEPVVYYCGLEEHTHDESCYDAAGELICGLVEHTHDESCLEQILIQTAEADGVRVTAAYGPEAGIPADAELRVSRILPSNGSGEVSKEYAQRVDEASKAYEESAPDRVLQPLALLDIGFYLPDGAEVEPAANTVTITLQLLDENGEAQGQPLTVIHFTEAGAEVQESADLDAGPDFEAATVFTAEGFSNYMVGYSIDPISLPGASLFSYERDYTKFEHNKRIDYLGDNSSSGGGNNVDTTLDDGGKVTDDKYRLYLDMVGKCEPVDLLLVLDRSGSMDKTDRDDQVETVLFGTNGLIQEFLKDNNGKAPKYQNQVAMVWYAGATPFDFTKDTRNASKKVNPDADTEGGLSFSWKTSYDAIEHNFGRDVQGGITHRKLGDVAPGNTATNYVAGFVQADSMLTKRPTYEDVPHKVVVIFISDGVPTLYYDSDQFNTWLGNKSTQLTRYGAGADSMSVNDIDSYDRVPADVGPLIFNYSKTKYTQRGSGKGQYTLTESGKQIITNNNLETLADSPYYQETLDCFKWFHDKYGTINFYTLAIDMLDTFGGLTVDGYNTRYALDLMAKSYGTTTLTVDSSNENELRNKLRQVMFPSGVTITDELSAFVDFYADQPDVKVTASDENGNVVATLWEGSQQNGTVYGEATTANATFDGAAKIGNYVVKDVTYENVDGVKKVAVHFNPEYCLNVKYTYTLSFNVEVTETAFDTFAANSNATERPVDLTNQAVLKQLYKDEGENDSDYKDTNNLTSTNKPGFDSNNSAYVDYTVDGTQGHLFYQEPVVQVWSSELKLVKKDDKENLLSDIAFRLEYTVDGNTTLVKPVPERAYTAASSGYYFTNAQGEIAYGRLHHGTYTLYENVQARFENPGDGKVVATFEVKKGRIINVQEGENLTWRHSVTTNHPNTNYNDSVTLTLVNPVAHPDFSVYKWNPEDNTGLAKAEFELWAYNEEVSAWYPVTRELKSDQTGFLFENNVPGAKPFVLESGRYYLVETKTPDHFWDLKEKTIYFKVDGTGITLTDANGNEKSYDEARVEGAVGNKLALYIYNEKVKSKAELIKVDVADNTKKLTGAKFELYEVAKDGKQADATLVWRGTSGEDGKFVSDPLPDGEKPDFPSLYAEKDYYLKETLPPDGYNKLPGDIKITVGETGEVTAMLLVEGNLDGSLVDVKAVKDENGAVTTYQIQIENSSGYTLPRSGGEGVTLYLLGGATLAAFAGAMLLLKRRKKNAA